MVEDSQIDENSNESIMLPEELSIAEAVECYRFLISRMEQGGNIELDAGSLTRIDAASIQLLLVVQRALGEAGHTLRWRSVSPMLKESVALLGMSECLALEA